MSNQTEDEAQVIRDLALVWTVARETRAACADLAVAPLSGEASARLMVTLRAQQSAQEAAARLDASRRSDRDDMLTDGV